MASAVSGSRSILCQEVFDTVRSVLEAGNDMSPELTQKLNDCYEKIITQRFSIEISAQRTRGAQIDSAALFSRAYEKCTPSTLPLGLQALAEKCHEAITHFSRAEMSKAQKRIDQHKEWDTSFAEVEKGKSPAKKEEEWEKAFEEVQTSDKTLPPHPLKKKGKLAEALTMLKQAHTDLTRPEDQPDDWEEAFQGHPG